MHHQPRELRLDRLPHSHRFYRHQRGRVRRRRLGPSGLRRARSGSRRVHPLDRLIVTRWSRKREHRPGTRRRPTSSVVPGPVTPWWAFPHDPPAEVPGDGGAATGNGAEGPRWRTAGRRPPRQNPGPGIGRSCRYRVERETPTVSDLHDRGPLSDHLRRLPPLDRGQRSRPTPVAAPGTGSGEPGLSSLPDDVALDYVDTRVLSRRFDRSISRVAGYRAFRGCPAEPAAS